jgi:ABC-2 type transport system permease protein
MKGLWACVWVEGLKIFKSKMFIITLVFFAFIAAMMGFMMFIVHHPELAGRSSAMSAKTSVLGKGDWFSFLNLLIQVILALGPIGFGMVTSWVFGREYIDRTAKDLLALPVSRITIVAAKFVVIAIWCILLTLTLFVVGILIGLAIRIPGWSQADCPHCLFIFIISSILTLMLCTPVAFLACLSRGYLLPVGFAILTLILTNFVAIGLPSIMPYFPWAVPALYTGIAGRDLPTADAISYCILIGTCITGFIATAAWWRFADQT